MSVDHDTLRELIKVNLAVDDGRTVERFLPVAVAAYHMALEDAGIDDEETIYEEGYDDGYSDGYAFGYEAGLDNHAADYTIQSARKVSPDV